VRSSEGSESDASPGRRALAATAAANIGAKHNDGAAAAGGAVPVGAVASGTPVHTGMYSRPKGALQPTNALSWTLTAIACWIFMNCSNAAGDELIENLRDDRFNVADLACTSAACIRCIRKRKRQEQPEFAVKKVKLDLSTCEAPRKQWLKA
jgi:hypothetical protein